MVTSKSKNKKKYTAKMVSYRTKPHITELMNKLCEEFKNKLHSKITKTDLVEMSLYSLDYLTLEEKKKALINFLGKSD